MQHGALLRAVPAIEGVTFPGVGMPATNAVLSLYYQLQQSEWWTPAQLEYHQRRQLQALVAHAANTPYYAPLLGRLGYESDGPLTASVWAGMPVLTRDTLQSSADALLNPHVPVAHGPATTLRTSGSTGTPVSVQVPQLVQFFRQAAAIRERMWHRCDLDGRYAYLSAFGNLDQAQRLPGVRAAGWRALEGVIETGGESFALDVRSGLDEQVRWLESVDPHYLSTYPSNLTALLGRAAARGESLRLPALRQVRTIGECVDDELRLLVAQSLDVPLVDEYSAREVGTIALQCPDYPVYHCLSELVKVEVLDDEGRACSPGETGRVVVTQLHNLRMPLIRYELGDYAEVGEPCACGRGLPVLTRIRGRRRNRAYCPDGERRWPLPGDGRYRGIAPIEQYQLVQRDRARLDANLVAGRELTPVEAERFTRWVQQRLGYPFELTLHYFARIPRQPDGRLENFRNDMPD